MARIVPPHGSGGSEMPRRHCLHYDRRDPDETAGRVLARRLAERDARMSLASWRAVRLAEESGK